MKNIIPALVLAVVISLGFLCFQEASVLNIEAIAARIDAKVALKMQLVNRRLENPCNRDLDRQIENLDLEIEQLQEEMNRMVP